MAGEVTRYSNPDYLLMTDDVIEGETCPAITDDDPPNRWLCTRVPDHEGDHQAGVGDDQAVASWPR